MKFFFKQKQKVFKLPKQVVSKITIEADMLNYRVEIGDLSKYSIDDCNVIDNFLNRFGNQLKKESICIYAALVGFMIQAQDVHYNLKFNCLKNI